MMLPEYLYADPAQYACLTEPVRMGRAQIIHADDRSALVYDHDARLHLLSARDEKSARTLLSMAEHTDFMMLADGEFAHLTDSLTYVQRMDCLQAVYLRKDPPEIDPRLKIAVADDAQLQMIICNYKMDTPRELRRRRDQGQLFFASDEKRRPVGFVGLHPEGCFGILKVMENMRGKGYGAALEAFILRWCLQNGRLPYCQVDVHNQVSLNLQKKMGLELSSRPMKMLWNDFG